MGLETQEIRKLVGLRTFNKAFQYPKEYINYEDTYERMGNRIHTFSVESERDYNLYDVDICEKNNKILSAECTCFKYNRSRMCKHIAACLLQYKEEIFTMDIEKRRLQVSRGILEEFYEGSSIEQIYLKKQLILTIELEFQNKYHKTVVFIKLKVGEDRLYHLNSRLNHFLNVYQNKEPSIQFGKNFTYDPLKHYFSKQDEQIIEYLLMLREGNPHYNYQNLHISLEQFPTFLERIGNKEFLMTNFGIIRLISRENPIRMSLLKENTVYKLILLNSNIKFLSDDYRYAVKDDILYQIPKKISKILNMMQKNKLHELIFKDEDLDLFSKGIFPIVKKNIQLDKTVKDQITFDIKPSIKIYLDLKIDNIFCNIKLNYQEYEIDYFDHTLHIIRDRETERKVIEDLLECGFEIENQNIYIDTLEKIGTFLDEKLEELSNKYQVFTSDKIRQTKVLKDNHIFSSFSIGQDNIMKYEFDLGNIKNDEIVNILETMKTKKRYYRLKSGDLIDLKQNHELKQFSDLISDMEISKKDLQTLSGIIPKYRSIYLDSIKKDKYSIIKTNHLFDELIKNFNSYKDIDIDLSLHDKKILRNYQQTGIKWLYNIYKCGFGAILADEMGLGKSIQLIYFIKQILKEKNDAKILIVAPTSLVYNWKNEFDKFGSEIKYKVFAENKLLRKKELEKIDNFNVLITTYGLIRQDQEKYLNIKFELVAIDEAQNIKNVASQMTKAIKKLNANTKIALTGTPLENSVMELWSIFDFIMPGYLASITIFQKKYNIKGDVSNLKLLENLNKQIKPFLLRRKKKDVIKELPEKIENNIYIDLNEEQKKLYIAQLEKTKEEMNNILSIDGFKKGNFKILGLLTQLRQLCIDPRILYKNYKGGSAKIENLISIVKETIKSGHKILLFTSYKTALEIVKDEFDKYHISNYVIDGSVSAKQRMQLVESFNHDETNVFLITLKAGGTGLNLTSADIVIHLDLWWNPQVENQATDRAHRMGQKNKVEVIKLICKGTIEERILELQNKKKLLSDALIEGEDRDQNILSTLTEEDIKNLLLLDNEEKNSCIL